VLALTQHRTQAGVRCLLERVVYPLPQGRQSHLTPTGCYGEGTAVSPTQVKGLSPAGTSRARGKVGGPSAGQIINDCKKGGNYLAKGIENFIVDRAAKELHTGLWDRFCVDKGEENNMGAAQGNLPERNYQCLPGGRKPPSPASLQGVVLLEDSRHEEKELDWDPSVIRPPGLCRQAVPGLLVHKGWSHRGLLFHRATLPAGTKASCKERDHRPSLPVN